MDTDGERRLDWLRLYRSENVGPIGFRKLLGRFGSARAALQALPGLARAGGRARPLRIAPLAEARAELDAVARIGGRLVIEPEPLYPEALRPVADAPPLLIILGNPALLARPAVAVVGARNCSISGRRMAESLARDLADAGFAVVSGMARGIDAAAHAGAGPDRTVAVLAGGADVTYPPENAKLHQAIRERGCVVSEMPPGTEPQARHFPRRNRIISGLARGVVVIEATARSGSLITARFALDQGREVFAVPGFPTDPRAAGPNRLIKDGAALVEGIDDILAVLEGAPQPLFPGFSAPEALAEAPSEDVSPSGDAKEKLLNSLSRAPLPVDVALRECQLSAAEGAAALMELELAGRIERLPGARIALVAAP